VTTPASAGPTPCRHPDRSSTARSGWRHALVDDHGLTVSAQVVVFLPFTVVLLFAGIQAALWQHTRVQTADIAHQVAAVTAADTQPLSATLSSAKTRLAARTDLTDVAITVDTAANGGELVVVTITGRVPGIITGTAIDVSVSSATPIEAWEPLP
jgi:hypothetical protein